ncbi:MAG: tetratricopeptide repeat protein [Chloroflexi bacterium]|nr:tetratricopeptide repeat protein [Chloroflexota bacterium]
MAASRRMLPAQPTSLVGREREVQALLGLLGRQDVRLVTLTGPGGIGKTRIGLAVAAEVRDHFPDGVTFVDLTPIEDPALLLASIADGFEIRHSGQRPLRDVLTEHLGEARLLLVLDGFDRLQPAATTVSDLLGRCPNLEILVTSRAPLHLRGEHEFPVPPLDVPAAGQPLDGRNLSRVPAVSLFVQRAVDVLPGFTLTDENAVTVAEICRRLDGLPLAIELAAARIKVLSPLALLRWLDRRLALLTGGARDLPERHRALRDTIAWSYDLLREDEQCLFRRLSVFVGGCTLEAIDAVDVGRDRDEVRAVPARQHAPASAPQPSLLDLVASLIDASLLRQVAGPGGEPRYVMLDTIREFGVEQLELAAEAAAARRAHLYWCSVFAERAEDQVRGPEGPEWLDRLAVELENVRAALTWSMADPATASTRVGLCLVGAFFPFWYFRSHLEEGRHWIQRLLAAESLLPADAADELPDGFAAGADPILHADAGSGWWSAIHPRVKARIGLCNLSQQLGNLQEAAAAIEPAIVTARALRDRLGEARATVWLGIVARSSGEYGRAVALMEASLTTFRSLGHPYGVWWTLDQLGETLMRIGEHARAHRCLEECVAVAETIDSPWALADARHRLGMVIFRQGDLDRASTLLEESLAGYTLMRAHGLHTCLLDLGTLALARDEPGRAATLFSQSLTRGHDIGDRNTCARSLEGLAQAFVMMGKGEADAWSIGAARLLGAGTALREEIAFTVAPVERHAVEQAESAIRATLGDQAYDTHWRDGRALSLDRAVELAQGLAARVESASTDPAASVIRSPSSTARSESPPPVSPLTERERDVASLIACGLRNRQIATSLTLSERTVHVHVSNILSKLGFKSRSQIAVWAVERGLRPPSES